MRRYLVILFSLALNLSFGQASWWYGNAGGSAPAGPDTLTLTYWNDFVLLHIANTGITEDVNGVSEWQDRSGNGNHSTQTVNANKPSTDVDGNVVFDGTDDYLDMTDIIQPGSDSAITVFIAGSLNDISGTENLVFIQDGDEDFLLRLSVSGYDSIGTSNAIRGASNTTYTADADSTLLDGSSFIYTYAASEGTEEIYHRWDQTTYTSTLVAPFNYTSPDVNSYISSNGSGGLFFNGKIKFIGIVNRKMTPSEIATTESELNSFFTIY